MNNLNDIYEKLDWNQPEEIQEEGRKEASKIEDITLLMQPLYEKRLWDNCARVIYKKDDETLIPYLGKLFEWLQDLNWPGAMIIFERLKKFKPENIKLSYENTIQEAFNKNDENWLYSLSYLLLNNDELRSKIHKNYLDILEKNENEY